MRGCVLAKITVVTYACPCAVYLKIIQCFMLIIAQ